jgi:hypothetical protein
MSRNFQYRKFLTYIIIRDPYLKLLHDLKFTGIGTTVYPLIYHTSSSVVYIFTVLVSVFHSPDCPWGPPSLLYIGYQIFPGDKGAGAWQ